MAIIKRIKITKESKYYIWLKSGLKIKKDTKYYSFHNSIDTAKDVLIKKYKDHINYCQNRINTYQTDIDYCQTNIDCYQNNIFKIKNITEEDIK